MFRHWLELLILIFKIHQVCPELPDSDEGQVADWGGSRKGDYLGEVGVDEVGVGVGGAGDVGEVEVDDVGVGVGDAGDLGEAGLVWVWVVADGFGGVGSIPSKRFYFCHFPSKSLSLSCHRPPGDFEEDLILIANKETSHYLCSHHQGKYYHCHHCQSLSISSPTIQALSNYAVDEIYIRETPSWMFVGDKVGNQELCCSSILFFF